MKGKYVCKSRCFGEPQGIFDTKNTGFKDSKKKPESSCFQTVPAGRRHLHLYRKPDICGPHASFYFLGKAKYFEVQYVKKNWTKKNGRALIHYIPDDTGSSSFGVFPTVVSRGDRVRPEHVKFLQTRHQDPAEVFYVRFSESSRAQGGKGWGAS